MTRGEVRASPAVELCFWSRKEGLQVRIGGRMEEISEPELLEHIVETRFTFLKPVVKAHGWEELMLFRAVRDSLLRGCLAVRSHLIGSKTGAPMQQDVVPWIRSQLRIAMGLHTAGLTQVRAVAAQSITPCSTCRCHRGESMSSERKHSLSELLGLESKALVARFGKVLGEQLGTGKQARTRQLDAKQKGFLEDIRHFARDLAQGDRREELATLLSGSIPQEAKKAICKGVAESGSLLVEWNLLDLLLKVKEAAAHEACRTLVTLNSPWLLCFASHAAHLKSSSLDPEEWSEAADDLCKANPQWADFTAALRKNSGDGMPTAGKGWRAAALASLRPEDIGRPDCTEPDQSKSDWSSSAWQEALNCYEDARQTRAGKELRRWLRALAVMWPDISVSDSWFRQSQKDTLAQRDRDEVEFLQRYLSHAPIKTREWYVNRKLEKPDFKDSFGTSLALQLLPGLPVETQRNLSGKVEQILTWDDRERVQQAASVLTKTSEPSDASVRTLLAHTQTAIGVEEEAKLFEILARRSSEQQLLNIQDLTESRLHAYLDLLVSLNREDLLTRELDRWVSSELKISPMAVVSAVRFAEDSQLTESGRSRLMVMVARRLHGLSASVARPESRAAMAAMAMLPILGQALIQNPPSDPDSTPAWWRKTLIRSWLERIPGDAGRRIEQLESLGFLRPPDTAAILVGLWAEGLRGLDTALDASRSASTTHTQTLQTALDRLADARRSVEVLMQERDERLPAWLSAFSARIIPYLRSYAEKLRRNQGLLELIEQIETEFLALQTSSEELTDADVSAAELVKNWLKQGLSELDLPWASFEPLPVEGTWLAEGSLPSGPLEGAAKLIADAGRRAYVHGLATSAERRLLMTWLRNALVALGKSPHAWDLWKGNRTALSASTSSHLSRCWRVCTAQVSEDELVSHLLMLIEERFGPSRGDQYWAMDTLIEELSCRRIAFSALASLDSELQAAIIERTGALLRDMTRRLAEANKELLRLEKDGLRQVARRIGPLLSLVELELQPVFALRSTLARLGLEPVLQGIGGTVEPEGTGGLQYRMINSLDSARSGPIPEPMQVSTMGVQVRGEASPVEAPILRVLGE